MSIRAATHSLGAAVAAVALLLPSSGLARVTFRRLATINGGASQVVATTRSADGALHLVFQAPSRDGLSAITISPRGQVGPVVTALSGWQAGQPGLVALPTGALAALFGAISPGHVSSVWEITSSDGGTTWSPAPVDVRAGGPNEALAYASDVTAAMAGSTPVLTLPQAGNIVIQSGLGAGSPNYALTNVADGATTDANLATDAASGQVVAAWPSIARNPLRDYLQGAAPSIGALQAVPGQFRNAQEIAGRDHGPGTFAPYTTDGTHVRLLRYGAGSVAVGRRRGTTAKRLGVATGPDGRIWVMWGDDSGGGLAVTRSNRAVTRFEPIQHVDPNAFALARIWGDGRLGPLDLLVGELPNTQTATPGAYYARLLPVLSAAVSTHAIRHRKHRVGTLVTVTVTDAGDAVSGATVKLKGHRAKTNRRGVARLTVRTGGRGALSVTAAGYQKLSRRIGL